MQEVAIENNPELFRLNETKSTIQEEKQCINERVNTDDDEQEVKNIIQIQNGLEEEQKLKKEEALKTDFNFPSAKIFLNTFNADEEAKEFIIPARMTVQELKQYIFEHICSSLSPQLINLEWIITNRPPNNKRITLKNHQTLLDIALDEINAEPYLNEKQKDHKAIEMIEDRFIFRMNLMKITLMELAKMLPKEMIEVRAQSDQITGEYYVAKTACDHWMGRECVVEMIKAALTDHSSSIKCPYADPSSGQFCSYLEFDFLKLVGIFTKEEEAQFRDKLSENFVKFKSVLCSNCNTPLMKGQSNFETGFCSACGFGQICFYCAKVIPEGEFQCSNVECNFEDQFLMRSPLTNHFSLQDQHGYSHNLYAPEHRACPKCYTIVEHQSGCKHMYCSGCQLEFCWICLSYANQTEAWTCSEPFAYCFDVAPAQVRKKIKEKQIVEQEKVEVASEFNLKAHL